MKETDKPRINVAKILKAEKAAKKRRAQQMPTAQAAINTLFLAWLRLKELGWREAMWCPKDGSQFLAVEAGSTGIHNCHYQGKWPDGTYWVLGEEESFPSHPILFKPSPKKVRQ
jgi:hypothetical protein